MMMVMAMTITIDSLLSRPKLDYDGGYDVALKGPSVVVEGYNGNSMRLRNLSICVKKYQQWV